MKQYIFLLLSILLASCSEQEISHDTPGGIAGEGLRLSVRLGNGAATRAVGDAFASASDEKRIDRLAFFVHTDEDGLQVYPPVPDDVTDPTVASADYPHNVYLAETAAGSRQYTADVTLTAGGGYMADIVAVANLPKDYDYNQIVTWDGLQDSVLVWAAEMPACTPGSGIDDPTRRAFVMYGYTRTELVKEETNAFALAMERLAARIDITNEAYVQGMTASDPKGGFLLSSVRLLRAQPASYLTPQPNYASPDVATISDWQVTDIPYGKATTLDADANPTREPDAVEAAAAENDATLQYLWRTLYTYENSDTEHAPTALEIKGTFRGTEVTRRIDFINADKQPVPIVRNHRYLVHILPAPGLTDITFDIKVSEWDAVDTVNVKPDQTVVPVIENIETNGEYNKEKKFIDLYYTQDGSITFDATCNFAPDVRVKYEEPKQGDWIKIEQSEPELITKSSKMYKRSFKITFPGMVAKESRNAMLLVHNGGSEVECDTIFVRHTITYPGTDLEGIPVEKDSVTTVWAPVNIGATRLPTEIYFPFDNDNNWITLSPEQVQSNFEQIGYVFQWGRKIPFRPPLDGSQTLDMAQLSKDEYLYYKDAVKPGYGNDKFVPVNYIIGQNTWYKYDNPTVLPSLIQEAGNIWPRQYDPCPIGWHVPTCDEWNHLLSVIDGEKYDSTDWIWRFTSPKLIIPFSYSYISDDGTASHHDIVTAIFWASAPVTNCVNAPFYMFNFNSNATSPIVQNIQNISTGASIRCIQDHT